ncbi:Interleukin-12 subunit beta [Apodemus speciosus]|uniref:Interleukin-12 subunit beta n=1 Tax=Apodemus speciosus TaxID=105296 RepID=A0ABQ0F9N1_APOSI
MSSLGALYRRLICMRIGLQELRFLSMCQQKLTISWFAMVLLVSPLMAMWELEKDEVDWCPDAPGETVNLTCDTPEEDDITWTSDQRRGVIGSGKTLTVTVKEFLDAGQYTCHKGGETLSRSHLLLHKKENGFWSTEILKNFKNKTFLKCEAPNYSGRFTCSWLVQRNIDLTFSIKSRSSSPDSRAVTCGAASLSPEKVTLNQRDYDKFSVACQEDVTCPTAEETLPVELALEARQQNKYENYSASFFIRDIIKPDPPKNLQVKLLKNSQVEVSWEYPDSWSTPHSYFSLKFFVRIQRKREKMKETDEGCNQKGAFLVEKTSTEVQCKGANVCVQAQDRYYNSSCSKWACVPCRGPILGCNFGRKENYFLLALQPRLRRGELKGG